MEKRRNISQDNAGNAITAATVLVADQKTGATATLYSDDGANIKANPFISSAVDGIYEYYAADGRYKETVSKTGYVTESIEDVVLFDGAYLVKATKAEVAALILTQYDAGKKIFITSADGGEFTVRYNGTPGTYADDGGSYCGTQFIPTNTPNGTIGIVRDVNGFVYPEMFGAVGDADKSAFTGTDDTTALNLATATGLPVKLQAYYKATDAITLSNEMRVDGIGRGKCGLVVPDTFNLSAVGVLTTSEVSTPGPDLSNFGIFMEQDPDETVRADIVQYPPTIDLVTFRQPRLNINDMRISGAYDGIDCTGNNGGVHITNLEIMALNKNLIFGGALDFIFLDGVEVWPFDYVGTALITNVWYDGNTFAMDAGRIDSLVANNFATFRAKIVIDGGFGLFSQLNLDGGDASVEFTGGAKYSIATLYSTSDQADDFAIKVSGTETKVTVGTMWVENATNMTGSNGIIQILTDATAELIISAIHAKTAGLDTRLAYMTNGTLIIDGGFFEPPQNVSLVNDWIDCNGGKLLLSNLRVRDKGTGTGNLVGIASDGRHSIENVIAAGWPVSIPAGSEQMHIAENEFVTKSSGSRRLIRTNVYEYTGSLDGSGNAAVAHGVTGPNTRYPLIQAYDVSGAARSPITVSSIEGTNINITGGTASGTYEVVMMVRP